MTDTGDARYQTCKVCGAKDCNCTMSDWVTKLQAENAALKEQLSEANKERAWVRRKLDIPEDTGFLSGEVTLAGTMHNVCAHAAGYDKYVESYKCDDKQGEIARLTVTCNALKEQVAQLKTQLEKNNPLLDEAAAELEKQEETIATLQSKSAALVDALERMNRAYVNLMENGRDRIVSLGGECDAVDVMERGDIYLRESRAELAAFKGEK